MHGCARTRACKRRGLLRAAGTVETLRWRMAYFMQVRLLHGVLPLLTKREVSLSRRIYSWLLGTSDETGTPVAPSVFSPWDARTSFTPDLYHISAGAALTLPTIGAGTALAPGHICTASNPVISAPGLGSPRQQPQLRCKVRAGG